MSVYMTGSHIKEICTSCGEGIKVCATAFVGKDPYHIHCLPTRNLPKKTGFFSNPVSKDSGKLKLLYVSERTDNASK